MPSGSMDDHAGFGVATSGAMPSIERLRVIAGSVRWKNRRLLVQAAADPDGAHTVLFAGVLEAPCRNRACRGTRRVQWRIFAVRVADPQRRRRCTIPRRRRCPRESPFATRSPAELGQRDKLVDRLERRAGAGVPIARTSRYPAEAAANSRIRWLALRSRPGTAARDGSASKSTSASPNRGRDAARRRYRRTSRGARHRGSSRTSSPDGNPAWCSGGAANFPTPMSLLVVVKCGRPRRAAFRFLLRASTPRLLRKRWSPLANQVGTVIKRDAISRFHRRASGRGPSSVGK